MIEVSNKVPDISYHIKKPPARSRNIFTDIRYFFLVRPAVITLINFKDEDERQVYCESILQRTGIKVNNLRMLNIHRIGIDAPAG